jgi:hypothetical protein
MEAYRHSKSRGSLRRSERLERVKPWGDEPTIHALAIDYGIKEVVVEWSNHTLKRNELLERERA